MCANTPSIASCIAPTPSLDPRSHSVHLLPNFDRFQLLTQSHLHHHTHKTVTPPSFGSLSVYPYKRIENLTNKTRSTSAKSP